MKTGRYIYLALFILLPGLQSLAQRQEVKFKLLSGTNGVALGKIVAMTRDRHGAIWFADQTNRCLTRFDGNTMTRYYHPNNVNLPGSKTTECIVADSAGFLWIGYNGMGINRFDPETNTYTRFEHNPDDPESLSSNWVSVILIDRLGNLWIGSQGGLDRLDQKSGKFIRYQHNAADPSSLSNNNVRAIYEDSQGTLWVGTGFTWDRTDEGGLNRFNRQQNNFTRYLHDPVNAHSLIDNKVRAIFEDDQGNFWIGTRSNGIHLLDRKSGRIDRIPINTDGTRGLIRPPVISPFDNINFITQDATGHLWFGTENTGIIRYDPITQTSLQYTSKQNSTSGFTDNSGWCSYASPEGPMWVSTGEASVFQVDLFTNTIPEHISDTLVINDITEETDNILWMGTQNGGLLRVDIQDGSVEQFKHDPRNPESLGDNSVVAVVKATDSIMWLGTKNGLNKIDPDTRIIKRILHDPSNKESLSNNNIRQIFEDRAHNLWIATHGGGLNRLDKRTEKFISYVNNPADTNSISENSVAGILQDDDGFIWVRTDTSGLNRLDIATGKFRRYLQAKAVKHFFKDSKGVIWVSIDFGVYCYNKGADKFYLQEDLIATLKNEVVNIIAEDHEQKMWFATSNGIYRLDQKNRQLIRLGRESGIYAQFVHTIKVNQKGHLLLINAIGYYVLDPDKIKIAPIVPKIHFTNLIVNGEPAKVGKNELLIEPFFNTKEIALSYEQNTFSLGVEAIDYSDVTMKTAQYKLEGYDKEWRELTSDNQVYYFEVPPGSYRFIATAINRSNGARAEKSFSIKIKPPWWRTWWAYCGYVLLVAGILDGARRVIIQRERLKSKLKLEQLEREKEHIQLEKAKEIDKAKTAFFTNISHEFRTPLTLIKGPAQNLLAEFSNRPSVKKQVKLIQHNADVLLKLINQLLDLAKLESGTVEVNATKVDLNAFLDVSIDSFSSRAKEKGIDLNYKLPEIRYHVSFDKDKVEAIITNLISNAVKFTLSEGRIAVNAKVNVVDSHDSGQLVVTVSDTGIGIPSEDQTKIFERFYQVNEGGAHKELGSGIGLSLVKELTELLGGKVTVKSEPGKGSEFCVIVPLQIEGIVTEVESPEPQEIEEVLNAHKSEEGSNGKTKLMIVEDNVELRSFIVSSLSGDYSFCEAGDGKEGIEIALQEIPELIISDVMMPEMDGITMTDKLKKDIRTSHIPIILLTAKATNESKIAGLNTGADDYLVKPFNNDELILKVRNMIASRNRVREKVRLELMREAPIMEVISADEKLLLKVKEAILARLSDEQLSVESLAEEIGLSRSQFYRKIIALTGLSVNELITTFRLERAAQLLAQQWGPVAQVGYEVGFSNPSYFSKRFKEKFGVAPSEYPHKDQTN